MPVAFVCCYATTLFVLLAMVGLINASTIVSSRIVEGIDKWSTDSVVISSSTLAAQSAQITTPEPFSGSINLSFLEGNCFTANEDRWEYVFCPYRNVTSKRTMGQKVNLLGVWGHWSKNSMSKIPIMEYVGGQGCNGEDSFLTGEKSPKDDKETRVSVTLVCNHTQPIESVSVLSVVETNCHYRFELGVPIACSLLEV